MKYTESHEWVEVADGIATVGITDHAQKELGDIVYVELPQINREVKIGQEAAVLESTKAAADVYAPISGMIVEVNTRLKEASDLVNQSPEKEGWIFKIKLKDPKELDALLTENDYRSKVNASS